MINVLICDDDQYMRKMLRKIVSENLSITNVYDTEDGIEALNIVQKQTINIALLDVDMPKLNGIETAKLISKISPSTRFIFITAHADYAIESFTVHPYDYLLKPVKIESLNDTLKNLVREVVPNNATITIRNSNKIFVINQKKILFIEKILRNTIVNTVEEEIVWNKTLTELEEKLNQNFVRVHNSFLVNIDKINKIENLGNQTYKIEFEGTKKTALISRNNFEKIRKIFAID